MTRYTVVANVNLDTDTVLGGTKLELPRPEKDQQVNQTKLH